MKLDATDATCSTDCAISSGFGGAFQNMEAFGECLRVSGARHGTAHRRVSAAGKNGVHTDAVGTNLHREHLGQSDQTGLGGRIGGHTGQAGGVSDEA